MNATQLAERIKHRIDTFCMAAEPDGIGIAVATPEPDAWADMPLPATLSFSGWIDPAATDGHPSGFVFIYSPETMAETVTGLDEYLEAVLLYVTCHVRFAPAIPDPDERRRMVEDRIYDHDPELLALLSHVQTGGAR